jgi:hypothetical protein
MKISVRVVCISLLSFWGIAFAQSPAGTNGNWLMGFNQTRISEKWSLHAEAQYRSYELHPNIEQLLLRSGINYHLNNTAFISVGYANVSNYAYNKDLMPGITTSENRIWQQVLMKNSIGRINFEHRYRLEQRWLKNNIENKYLNRIRYLLRTSVPLNTKVIEKKTLFFTMYDEVFLHFNSNPFDRNRLYGAFGFQFLKLTNFQIGGLLQTVNNVTKSYLQLAMFYNLDFRNPTQ